MSDEIKFFNKDIIKLLLNIFPLFLLFSINNKVIPVKLAANDAEKASPSRPIPIIFIKIMLSAIFKDIPIIEILIGVFPSLKE